MDRFVIISGCSGGGKSTLLAELRRRGHAVVKEPGRRIVKRSRVAAARRSRRRIKLPSLARAIAMALADRTSAVALDGWVFFDRGLIDAASGLQHLTGEQLLATLAMPRNSRAASLLAAR